MYGDQFGELVCWYWGLKGWKTLTWNENWPVTQIVQRGTLPSVSADESGISSGLSPSLILNLLKSITINWSVQWHVDTTNH